jgi:hypothetical protein
MTSLHFIFFAHGYKLIIDIVIAYQKCTHLLKRLQFPSHVVVSYRTELTNRKHCESLQESTSSNFYEDLSNCFPVNVAAVCENLEGIDTLTTMPLTVETKVLVKLTPSPAFGPSRLALTVILLTSTGKATVRISSGIPTVSTQRVFHDALAPQLNEGFLLILFFGVNYSLLS